MPDLPNRRQHESTLKDAVDAILQRWAAELAAAVKIEFSQPRGTASTPQLPIFVATESDREAVQLALAGPFSQASAGLAKQLAFPLGESLTTISAMFVATFASNLCDQLADNTNRQLAKILAKILADEKKAADKISSDAAGQPKSFRGVATKSIGDRLKTVGKKLLDKAKDTILSVKRAARVAATEVTRMVSAGERIVANAWNRAFGRSRPAGVDIAKDGSPVTSEKPRPKGAIPPDKQVKLTARWHVETSATDEPDKKVCPLCLALHLLFEDEWPPEASGGPSLHVACRCWLTWEVRPIKPITV